MKMSFPLVGNLSSKKDCGQAAMTKIGRYFKVKIKYKLLILVLISIALSLFLVGVSISYLIKSFHEEKAERHLQEAFNILTKDLKERSDSVSIQNFGLCSKEHSTVFFPL
jgi:hypothetical protein